MIPGEIRRYKKSTFQHSLLSTSDDGEQPEQRNLRSCFPRLSESGGLTGTRLPQIVDRQALVASSQADRNPHYRAYEPEVHRERAPSRHHPNRGKRSRGTIDSDLEHMVGYVGGQNSKPFSQQKLRKRRKHVRKGDNQLNLLDEEDISSLEKITDSDSSENRRLSTRRRHKSQLRESPYSSPVVKENRRHRVQSFDRSSAKSASTKSLSEVKDDLRRPKSRSKKATEDVLIEDEDQNSQIEKRWKRFMARYSKRPAPACDGNLPADYWEEECRAANELIASLQKSTTGSKRKTEVVNDVKETKDSEQSEAEGRLKEKDQGLLYEEYHKVYKASIEYEESYTKFQNSRRFGTGLKQSDRKKVKHFTALIKDKARKKSAEAYSERISENKSEHDDINIVSHSSKIAKVEEVLTTKSLHVKSSKVKGKQIKECLKGMNTIKYSRGEMKVSTENNKKEELTGKKFKKENSDYMYKQKEEKTKDNWHCQNYKRKKKRDIKRDDIDDKIYGHIVPIHKKKTKTDYKGTCNVNVVDASENLFSEQKIKSSNTGKILKRSEPMKPTAAPLENHSSIKQAITVSKRPLVQKCKKSMPIRPTATKNATPKSDRKETSTPVTKKCSFTTEKLTSPSGIPATAKRCYTVSGKAVSNRFTTPAPKATGSARPDDKSPNYVSGRKATVKSVTNGIGSPSTTIHATFVSGRSASLERKASLSGKSTSGIQASVSESTKSGKVLMPVSAKCDKAVSGQISPLKLRSLAPGMNASSKRSTSESEELVATRRDTPVSGRPASRRQCIPVLRRTAVANPCTDMNVKTDAGKVSTFPPKPGLILPEKPATARPDSPVSKIPVPTRDTAVKSSSPVSERHSSAGHCTPLAGRIDSARSATGLTDRLVLAKSGTPASERFTQAEHTAQVSKIPLSTRSRTSVSNRSTKSSSIVSKRSASAISNTSVSEGPASPIPESSSKRQGSTRHGAFVLERAHITTSERPVSGKSESRIPRRVTSAKYTNHVLERSSSAKPDIPLSGRSSASAPQTEKAGRQTKSNILVSGRPTFEKSDNPISRRTPFARHAPSVTNRPSSTAKCSSPGNGRQVTETSELRRPVVARHSTPVYGKPPERELATTMSGMSATKTHRPNRPASAKRGTHVTAKPSFAEPGTPVSARLSSAESNTRVSGRTASAEINTHETGSRTSTKADIPVTGRTSSAGLNFHLTERSGSTKPDTPLTERTASVERNSCINGKVVFAEINTRVTGRNTSFKTDTHVTGRASSTESYTYVTERSDSIKNVSASTSSVEPRVIRRAAAAESYTHVTEKSCSTKHLTDRSRSAEPREIRRAAAVEPKTPVSESSCSIKHSIARTSSAEPRVTRRAAAAEPKTPVSESSCSTKHSIARKSFAEPRVTRRAAAAEPKTPVSESSCSTKHLVARTSSAEPRVTRRAAAAEPKNPVSESSCSTKHSIARTSSAEPRVTRRAVAVEPKSPVSERSSSTKHSVARTSSAVTRRAADVEPKSPVSERSSSTKHENPVIEKTVSVEPSSHMTGRTTSTKPDTPKIDRTASAESITDMTRRSDYAKANAHVSVRTASTEDDMRTACAEVNTRGDWITFSAKADTPVTGRTSFVKADTPVTGRTSSAKADTPVTRRTSSAKADTPVTGRTSSAKADTLVNGRTSTAEADTPVTGRTSSAEAKAQGIGRTDSVLLDTHATKHANRLSKRPASAKSGTYAIENLVMTKSTTPDAKRSAPTKPIIPKIKTPASAKRVIPAALAKYANGVDERLACTKPASSMTERLGPSKPATPLEGRTSIANFAPGRTTSVKHSTPEHPPSRKRIGSAKPRSARSMTGTMSSASTIRAASVRSRMSPATTDDHVTVDVTASISNASNCTYYDNFEYESAPSRSSFSKSDDNIAKYLFD